MIQSPFTHHCVTLGIVNARIMCLRITFVLRHHLIYPGVHRIQQPPPKDPNQKSPNKETHIESHTYKVYSWRRAGVTNMLHNGIKIQNILAAWEYGPKRKNIKFSGNNILYLGLETLIPYV